MKTGEILNPDDIFINSTESKTKIYDLLVAKIQNDYTENSLFNDEETGNWKEIVKSKMFETGVWGLTNEGIEFDFPKYSIGQGDIGIVSECIKYIDINNYLKTDIQFK